MNGIMHRASLSASWPQSQSDQNTPSYPVPKKALNPRIIPHREWPYSGLNKFHDLLTVLGDDIDRHDYFFFLDADVKFEEEVRLADIAGDLVGVEHPMYPRFSSAFCPENRGLCDFPYDRNPHCHAFVPWEYGKQKPDYDYGNW